MRTEQPINEARPGGSELNAELDALKFLALQFADLFEGCGTSDTERTQDALRRAKQIMTNLEPFVRHVGKQLPSFTKDSLPHGWEPPNAELTGRDPEAKQ